MTKRGILHHVYFKYLSNGAVSNVTEDKAVYAIQNDNTFKFCEISIIT